MLVLQIPSGPDAQGVAFGLRGGMYSERALPYSLKVSMLWPKECTCHCSVYRLTHGGHVPVPHAPRLFGLLLRDSDVGAFLANRGLFLLSLVRAWV